MNERQVASSPTHQANKRPFPHRLHLSDGRVVEGSIHREPHSRLADDLSALGQFISLIDVRLTITGREIPFLVVNRDHVVSIEEL